jgi:hypothetical protein
MKPEGEIVEVGAEDSETGHPKSKDLIDTLQNSLRKIAHNNQCRAIALIFNVTIKLPRSDRESDAVQVCLEHVDGYSVEVFFPYQIVNKEIVYGDTFAQKGKHDIF